MPRRFKTNQAHFDAFSQQQRMRFEDEMLAHLRREYGHVLGRRDDAWVRELIRVGIDQAAEYEIVLERDVARYLELMLVLSPDFDDSDETPWAGNILTDASLSPDEKLNRIYEFVLFGEQPRKSIQGSTGGAPRPFHRDAVQTADSRIRTEYPGIDPTRLTMDAADCESRQAWMSVYHQSLADLEVPPVTSRPDVEVGGPVVDRASPPGGNLTIVLVDAASNEPIVGASVQVSGPSIERAVANYSGVARFEGVAIGEYEVFAIDAQHRLGRGKATVKRGQTQLSLSCRRVSGVSGAP